MAESQREDGEAYRGQRAETSLPTNEESVKNICKRYGMYLRFPEMGVRIFNLLMAVTVFSQTVWPEQGPCPCGGQLCTSI